MARADAEFLSPWTQKRISVVVQAVAAADEHALALQSPIFTRRLVTVPLVRVYHVITISPAVFANHAPICTRKLKKVVQISVADASPEIGGPNLVHLMPLPAQCLDGLPFRASGARIRIRHHVGGEQYPHLPGSREPNKASAIAGI